MNVNRGETGVPPTPRNSSEETRRTLEEAPVHDTWVRGFRTAENRRFFGCAIDRLMALSGARPGDRILDAGCGSGTKSLLLAERGLDVTAVDFSEYVLDKARLDAQQAGLSDNLRFLRDDLLALSFPDGAFPNVFCWGVVMHIPDYDRALDELARVVAPGGCLMISEGNMYSLQSVLLCTAKRLLRRQRAEIVADEIGIQSWEDSAAGRLMTRQTNIPALVTALERRGLHLEHRFAGQFSELYMVTGNSFLQRLIHALNSFWFTWIRSGRLAYGNLLVFRKMQGLDAGPRR